MDGGYTGKPFAEVQCIGSLQAYWEPRWNVVKRSELHTFVVDDAIDPPQNVKEITRRARLRNAGEKFGTSHWMRTTQ